MITELQKLFVRFIYADHNSSKAVKNNLNSLLKQIDTGHVGLNIGSGNTSLHPQMMNLDIFAGPHVHCVASAENLPFANDSFDIIVTQETLEHVANPFKAMEEIARVIKLGGLLYCQLPFIIGFHPGPQDYWRFTTQGIRQLIENAGLIVVRSGVTVGGATGYYRISVEFWSILFSLGRPPLYKAFKVLFSLILYPIKWLDFIYNRSPEHDRIAGGYFIIARKG
jgi:SAM-dependent methyltransferase